MSRKNQFLDCCPAPDLETVKQLEMSYHQAKILRRCRNCQSYWFYQFEETISFSGGEDEITEFYVPLTAEETRPIVESEEQPDLSFLLGRESFVQDSCGVRKIKGLPRI